MTEGDKNTDNFKKFVRFQLLLRLKYDLPSEVGALIIGDRGRRKAKGSTHS